MSEASSRHQASAAAMHATALVVVSGVLLAGWLAPRAYSRLLQEDGWAEWATFLLFATAGWLGFSGLRAASGTLERVALVGLASFAVFVAGEEISWGQRLLGFAPPELFLEKNYQQESNLHNLLKQVLDTRWMVMIIALSYGVVSPLLTRVTPSWPRAFAPSWTLSPWFAVVALLELSYPFTLTGELAELGLGLCFVADLALRTRADWGHRTALWATMLPLLVAAAVPSAVDALTALGAEEDTARAREELALLADDLRKHEVVQPSLRRKRRVHKRVFTATRGGYLRFDEHSAFLGGHPTPAQGDADDARHDARGYFMDPWQQPYWVRYERVEPRHARLLLYSFGANRRRDSQLERLRESGEAERVLSGDDVGVVLDVQWR